MPVVQLDEGRVDGGRRGSPYGEAHSPRPRHPLPAVTRFGIVHVTDGGTRLYEADVTERDWIAFRACLNLWDWQKNGGKAA